MYGWLLLMGRDGGMVWKDYDDGDLLLLLLWFIWFWLLLVL